MRAELVVLVEQKHVESVNYHAQLQMLLAEKDQQTSTLATSSGRISTLEQELKRLLRFEANFLYV